jgi:hypothetical protein
MGTSAGAPAPSAEAKVNVKRPIWQGNLTWNATGNNVSIAVEAIQQNAVEP